MTDVMPRNFLTKPSSEPVKIVLTVREQHIALQKCNACGARFAASFSRDFGKTWFCGPCRPWEPARPVQGTLI